MTTTTATREKPALRVTKDYSVFVLTKENRVVDMDCRKKLLQSMQKYGYLPAYPVHVKKMPSGKLEIRDGQHRYLTAQKLGLNVWYVITDEDIEIAEINGTQKSWNVKDFAKSFAAQGKKDYQELLEFTDLYGVPISLAVCILTGTIGGGSSVMRQYRDGEFKIKTRERASIIARCFSTMVRINRGVNNARLLAAIYACSYVSTFDADRLIEGANRSPESLVAYGTRDAYLTMCEDLYNFGRKMRIPLKIPAENAMRDRNSAKLKLEED